MIKLLKISNFRSIKDASIDLAPITFVYGNNATGKSSIFYALNVLRNVLINPNQTVDSFFNLGFVNMGGFKQVVFKHDESQPISISVTTKIDSNNFIYKLIIFKNNQGEFLLEAGKPYELKFSVPVSFPYPSNKSDQKEIKIDEVNYKINWTGIIAQVTAEPASEEANRKAVAITTLFNRAPESARSVDVVPLRRGFTQPNYGIVNVGNFPIKEEELATQLAQDEYLESKVSTYLEYIVDRQFRARTVPGTSTVYLTTVEKESKQAVDIVNDGFGINQLAYTLAKILNQNSKLICIEEPEINLHPKILRKLPKVFYEIIKEEGKQLVISTHSETLMIAVLSAIARGDIQRQDVACYLIKREHGITSFQRQEITKDGQIQGGLIPFMEGELEEIEGFLKGERNSELDKKSDRKIISEGS